MTEFWESAFVDKQLMWGLEPTASALFASEYFGRRGAREVLIPGIGYGRNAKPFLRHGISVTGIEISETAIGFARSQLGLQDPIYHGSVTDMPYDYRLYDGVFCYGLVYLLNGAERQKFIQDCYRQLKPGGHMIFTVISKKAPMYGQGKELGKDWYERMPNLSMYFYDAESVRQEFGSHGLINVAEVNEPSPGGTFIPFINVICGKNTDPNAAVKGLNAGHSEVTVEGLIERNQVEAIAEALKTSNSTILRMGDCQVGDRGGELIGDALAGNTALKELWLFNNDLGEVSGRAIGNALKTMPSLTTLCLYGNQVGGDFGKALGEALLGATCLEKLGLGHNQIGDVGAQAIGNALVSNTSVTTLNLNNNQVGNIGAQAIGDALRTNTSLTSLGLHHNEIGDIGAKAISDGLQNNVSLQTLRLSNNQIGDAGAKSMRVAVARNTTLTSLYFDGNPATPASLAGIEAVLKSSGR